MQSANVYVKIDLGRIRENVASIAGRCGVDVIAVVKSDGYGLGARQVAETIGDLVAGFCVFNPKEAISAGLWDIAHKSTLSLGPSTDFDPDDLLAAGVRPAVWTESEALRLRRARPVLSVDTGMQRFACPPRDVELVVSAGAIDEAFTHATRIEHVDALRAIVGNHTLRLHAAATSLLDQPAARLDAVRPGLAIYRGAARVSARLIEVRDGTGPAGYTGFIAQRFGVILCGYSNGLRPGPCLVNGQRRRVLEVGMQSAFVELATGDRDGDEVILLGEGLTEAEVGGQWQCSEQQVLTMLGGAGICSYEGV